MSENAAGTGRAVPFHCPYCGDTNLWPREGGWECRSCLRAFSVTMLGHLDRHSDPEAGR